jgi:hypothetical protein
MQSMVERTRAGNAVVVAPPREKATHTEAKTKTLVGASVAKAYSEGLLGERHADSAEAAREWARVAVAIARLTGSGPPSRGLALKPRLDDDGARLLADADLFHSRGG